MHDNEKFHLTIADFPVMKNNNELIVRFQRSNKSKFDEKKTNKSISESFLHLIDHARLRYNGSLRTSSRW